MTDYLKMLKDGYEECVSWDMNPPENRLQYLGDYIFDFTTYDSGASELFATIALEVCQAINTSTTFDYIKDATKYTWFLLMCNLPFFSTRINWGTSIRGAWWDGRAHIMQINYRDTGLPAGDLPKFIDAMLAFARGK